MNFIFPVLALAGLTLVGTLTWWLVNRRPEQWASWVDRENDFWRERGWVSAGVAEKMKRWEKGWPLKFLAAAISIIGAVGLALTLVVLMKAISIEHQKLRMPYDPALQQKARH